MIIDYPELTFRALVQSEANTGEHEQVNVTDRLPARSQYPNTPVILRRVLLNIGKIEIKRY